MGSKWPLVGLAAAVATLVAAAVVGAAPTRPFPVTLKAANGYVTVDKRPVRVLSLSPTATETLFAIGAGAQVVAVDNQSNYPVGAPMTKLSGYRPNAEAVAAYQPDLVVTSSAANNLIPALDKLHIPVLLEPSAKSIGDAYVQMRQLGFATGHDAEARKLVSQMKAKIDAAVTATPKPKSVSVYHELSPDFYSATSKTFIGRVYALFGIGNIADAADKTGSGYPQLSAEYVIASNPSLIVLADTKCCGQTAASVKGRAGWSSIRAVQRGNVVAASDDVTSRWGPRIVDFVRVVAAAIRRAGR
ncbi:MAG: ABC transporter substrate-binding protein [Gaiellaceae bacterium]